ncbi:MAG: hypothetical protein EPN20_20275, partial [Magnetospirillum sp.]
MPVEELRYDKMVEDALRGVVRDALTFAAEQGLPGDHHFYVTFRTHYPGVALPKHVLARHPDEMTIVLQHQFWDLDVSFEQFAVTLSFSGKSERLVIPFTAVTGFADPSAKFGLQFQAIPGDDEDENENEDEGGTFEDAAPPSPDSDSAK